MKQILLTTMMLLGFARLALAHVGSPNVFFEGRAGGYPIYAVIRPPAVLPGAAQVSVRVQDAGVDAVSLVPVIWQAGRPGSPEPVPAQRVAGEKDLWSAEVWFLRPGSYTVRIGIEGSRGPGEATVPVNVLGMQGQPMSAGLRITLFALGLGLVFSAVLIVRAIACECGLEPDVRPAVLRFPRGRLPAGIALLLLTVGIAVGAVRWRNMDLDYRTQGMQKPEPVAAEIKSEKDGVLLELRPNDPSLPLWSALAPDHGKLMHLFLIREPGLDVFAHLHPVRLDGRTFDLEVPALPAGEYQLYGDVTFENGLSQTLIARINLPEPPGGVLALPPVTTNLVGEAICGFPVALATNSGPLSRDLDDSWHVDQARSTNPANLKYPGGGRINLLMGGHTLLFENADDVIAGRATSLRFAAFTSDGSAAVLQPYMGMLGHAAVRRADGSVFAHLHPLGSFSMAAEEVFRQRDPVDGPAGIRPPLATSPGAAPNRVSFPYQFPKPGAYRVWIQVRIGGRVLTGVYDLDIKRGA